MNVDDVFSEVSSVIYSQPHYPRHVPDMLEVFHYTSGSGLAGILASGVLLAGHYAYMNDSSEFEYGQALLLEVVREALADATTENDKQMLLLAMRYRNDIFSPYLSCFCEEPDLLSQWRGYGDQTGRYCLRLDISEMRDAHEHARGLFSVIYDDGLQRRLLREAVDAYLKAMHDHEKTFASRDLIPAAANWLHNTAVSMLIRFKNPVFSEEREWRYNCWFRTKQHMDFLRFMPAEGVLKPYIPMLSGSVSDPEHLPIREVIVGASRHQALAEKTAALLLARYGYRNVKVTLSRVPLRG